MLTSCKGGRIDIGKGSRNVRDEMTSAQSNNYVSAVVMWEGEYCSVTEFRDDLNISISFDDAGEAAFSVAAADWCDIGSRTAKSPTGPSDAPGNLRRSSSIRS